ncbi:34-kDa subunit of RNA polymerase III (C) [Tulasnella sp. 403]|nr:34-kDa subunit of RNA polymerase III (C) [Tulasnella sp. 403]
MASSSGSSIETQVWKVVSENPGSTAAQLGPRLKSISKKDLVTALNALLSKDLVKVSRTGDSQLTWKAVDISDAKVKNAMAGDERMVYSAIEAAGNQGIWSRSIQTQTNLPGAVVTKILSKLISSKQVKLVKSVTHRTRKIYMLHDIEPSIELTGGPWYTDFELDPIFIGFVKSACLKFVQKKSFPNPEDDSPSAPLFPASNTDRYPDINDITRFIKNAKITEVSLLPEHIEEVMNVLIYEGLVEKLPGGGKDRSTSRGKDADESGSDSDDEELGREIKKSKSKKRKQTKKVSSDDDSGSDDEAKRRKRRKKLLESDGSDDEKASRSRSHSRSKKPKRDKEMDSDSSGAESKTRHRKRDRLASSDSDSDVKSSSSKHRRKTKSDKSKRKDSNLEESNTLSSDSGGSASEDEKRSAKRGASKNSTKKDRVEDDVDLETAFGHLLSGGSVYRAIRQERVGLGWSQAPCGRCPQLDFCDDNGPVNPTGCKYYSDWLSQAIGD